jgi:hypothetical protein
MTRRALFGLLPAVAVAAQPGSGLTIEWSFYEVRDGSNLRTSHGIQFQVKCNDPQALPYIAGYEFTVWWQPARGNAEARTVVRAPWEPFWWLRSVGGNSGYRAGTERGEIR